MTEGIIFRYRTGTPWRDLPEIFGPWQTVWKRHYRFSTDGTWDKILTALLAQADAEVKGASRDAQFALERAIVRVASARGR